MAKAATATVRTYPSSVGVPDRNRQALIALLNLRLADSTDVHSQVKWAHWNVKGKDFYQLHLLFDSVATHLEAAATSSIPEADLSAYDGPDMVKFLVHNVGHYTNALRAAIQEADDLEDAVTVDLFTSITREMDKDLWFIEAHIQSL